MRHWLRSYGLLIRWNVLRMKSVLPLYFVVQALLAVGVTIGFSFLIPHVNRQTAFYLATGAPTLGLITVGMVVAPQIVASQKIEGIFEYQRSLPVPRLSMLAADASVWIMSALPGLAAALGVAAVKYHLHYSVSPLVVVALLLVALTSVAIGYGIAYATPPMLTNILTQVIVFVAIMFSPVDFPPSRLPDWLAKGHEWLPFVYMAQAIRDTINTPATGIPLKPFLVLTAYCVVGLSVTYRVMARRP